MNNPYSVLGVSPGATDEEIKAAYRDLARRYSDADYVADPLQNVAGTRMQELNDAYDQIMAERRTGGQRAASAPFGEQTGAAQNTGAYSARYSDIRALLRGGDLLSAEQRLTSIDAAQRGAEWNFLMGSLCQAKGWLDEAYRYFGLACSQEPSNAEYAAAYNRMSRERAAGGTAYNPYARQGRGAGCMGDDACNTACQCLCLYQLCSSCCCSGR